jgi:hypothetical protein
MEATLQDFRTFHIRTSPFVMQAVVLARTRFTWVAHSSDQGRPRGCYGSKTLRLAKQAALFRIAKLQPLESNDLFDQVDDVSHL